MKNRSIVTLLYIMIVMLPVLSMSFFYSKELKQKDEAERIDHAKWVANIHEEHWNTLISESVTIMDMLSVTAASIQEYPNQLDAILYKANQSDPRYGGIYLLDAMGNVIAGNTLLLSEQNLAAQPYIQEVIASKDTIISDQNEILTNGQNVVGIAKPVLSDNQKLLFIIVAYLKVGYIQNVTEMLTPEDQFFITNSDNKKIMRVIGNESISMTDKYYSLPIERIPWEIHVVIQEANKQLLRWKMINFALMILVICHIVYLLTYYLLKRRQVIKQKKENDLHKLELVGTFAASIAHEIRNPLTGIKGLVQLLSEKYTSEKDLTYFSVINQEINRINEIVSEFLVLGKPSVIKTESTKINEILTELVPLIDYEAKRYHHECKFLIPDNPIFVHCSKDQMKQVLLNICKNAIESMQTRGQLTINLQLKNNACQLLISDTGMGISAKEMKKIFKPFYTSKETGTGLGLVVCKRIIDSFGGEITFDSKVNKGTTVTISLPVSEATPD
ncbi:PAS domain-containing sensor histidine kinase [Bacillus tuaregi]|uniref:PAS domain-containing sensor histidine kinase n=1 Tax=Bacillus tuaregi TaxID=1816695 RepID=UPI0008F942EA|nr:PAS domain-containing sensor histidine kinase [Bacillus tuaregi]